MNREDLELEKVIKELALSDCGDNSCLFAGRGKGGMRTNGGCQCIDKFASAILTWHKQREVELLEELEIEIFKPRPHLEYPLDLRKLLHKLIKERIVGK